MDWDKDVGVAGRKRRERFGVRRTFDEFDSARRIAQTKPWQPSVLSNMVVS